MSVAIPQCVRRVALAGALVLAIFAATGPATAQSSQSAEPTREQLQLQIDIMREYIKKLEANAQPPAPAPDSELENAQKSAHLRELQYAKEKYDIVMDGYRESRWSNRIVLAIVVLMVLAGIAFSGFQLWKSVNLVPGAPTASAGTMPGQGSGLAASDVEISASKIRITSTVVGVLVLVISIAFFYIYMKDLTAVRVVGDVGIDKPSAAK